MSGMLCRSGLVPTSGCIRIAVEEDEMDSWEGGDDETGVAEELGATTDPDTDMLICALGDSNSTVGMHGALGDDAAAAVRRAAAVRSDASWLACARSRRCTFIWPPSACAVRNSRWQKLHEYERGGHCPLLDASSANARTSQESLSIAPLTRLLHVLPPHDVCAPADDTQLAIIGHACCSEGCMMWAVIALTSTQKSPSRD